MASTWTQLRTSAYLCLLAVTTTSPITAPASTAQPTMSLTLVELVFPASNVQIANFSKTESVLMFPWPACPSSATEHAQLVPPVTL